MTNYHISNPHEPSRYKTMKCPMSTAMFSTYPLFGDYFSCRVNLRMDKEFVWEIPSPSRSIEKKRPKRKWIIFQLSIFRVLSQRIHGTIVYLPTFTWLVNVGKYTILMDPIGYVSFQARICIYCHHPRSPTFQGHHPVPHWGAILRSQSTQWQAVIFWGGC